MENLGKNELRLVAIGSQVDALTAKAIIKRTDVGLRQTPADGAKPTLKLQYLANDFGNAEEPYGWCWADGVLGMDAVIEGPVHASLLYDELSAIARAFPGVDMTVGIFMDATDSEPVICYHASRGVVETDNGTGLLTEIDKRAAGQMWDQAELFGGVE